MHMLIQTVQKTFDQQDIFQKSKWPPSSCEYLSSQSVGHSEGDVEGNFKIRLGVFYGQRRLQLSHDY